MEIQELIEKCKNRDQSAWTQFVKRFAHVVRCAVKYKLKLTGFKNMLSDLDDIVQEIFMDIWDKRKLDKIRDINSIKDWLVVVSINATLNYLRDKNAEYTSKSVSFDDEYDNRDKVKSIFESRNIDIWENIYKKDMMDAVRREIGLLSPKKQIAIKLHVFDSMTFKDVAAIMNIPHSTAGTLIKRAKEEIADNLKKYI